MTDGDDATPEAGAFPFAFACRRSGNCCARPGGRVRASEAEARAMAALLGLGYDGFRTRYLVPGPGGDWLVKDAPGGACPFLGREDGLATCAVYAARPAHCRSFPHWPELAEDGPALREATRFCPGIVPRAGGGDPALPRR
ncbi:MAG: YkgJ family cysteine cluster protein [Planctomycetota bacterium]